MTLRRLARPVPIAVALALPLTGCFETLTWREASDAMVEAAAAGRVSTFTSGVVEMTTDFTLGQAAEDAAQELADFVQSQIPCSTVTREGTTVTMDFGELGDLCVWNGRTYAGVASVTLDSVEAGWAVVTHAWDGMTDGFVTMDGSATVTWDAEAGTRRVEHVFEWTDVDGSARTGTGDRLQSLLDEDQGLSGGILIDGERGWSGPAGDWLLDIDMVQARPQDPVPQAGAYVLTLPSGKVATLSFSRIDEDTIEVVLSGAREDHVWHVTSTGTEYQES